MHVDVVLLSLCRYFIRKTSQWCSKSQKFHGGTWVKQGHKLAQSCTIPIKMTNSGWVTQGNIFTLIEVWHPHLDLGKSINLDAGIRLNIECRQFLCIITPIVFNISKSQPLLHGPLCTWKHLASTSVLINNVVTPLHQALFNVSNWCVINDHQLLLYDQFQIKLL